MTTRTQQLSARRWVLVFLAALVAVLATIFGAATASAATAGVAETRVGASAVTVDVLVEPPQHIAAGQQLGKDVAGPGIVVATGVAAKTVPATNKIFSNRALQGMADDPGPMHNFPGSFDETVFSQGTRTVNPGYFNKPKPNLANDSIQYRLPGVITGRSGVYEIFTRPSTSGRTEMIIHRFFRPDF